MNRLFEIEMEYGMHKEALNTINKAQTADKDYMRYFLMHADALAALGRFQESLAMLDNAEIKIAGEQKSYLNDLKRMRKAIINIASRVKKQ